MDFNFLNMKFKTWQEAASYCFKHHIWGKVTIVLKGDYYVIEEK